MTLQWRRKILLGAKISAIRLNKDDNLPDYYDECLLQPMFVPKHFSFVKREKIVYKMLLYRHWWNTRISFYISSSHAVKILFLTFTCEDLGVAMVTNMISQLQELPTRRAAGSFEISFTKWLRGAKTVQLPVTFSMSCQIFTSILFPSVKNIQEDLPKSGNEKSCLLCRNFISIENRFSCLALVWNLVTVNDL